MRQKHETAISFNELKAITQTIQALKKGAPTNATNQESENANISDLTQETGLKPKAMLQAKKGTLNPTKKAFSERQKTTIRDNEQASAKKRLQTNQGNNSNLRAKQSNKAFKTGLTTHQSNKKGGKNEA
ncbi:hypothetical protein KVD42_01080 [Helicobacter pylori]|nr:hypothetical protein KVD42_01080 [Helicobacter pylori]